MGDNFGCACWKGRPDEERYESTIPNNNPSAATGAIGASPSPTDSQSSSINSQPSSTAGDNRTHGECEEDIELTPDNHPSATGTPPDFEIPKEDRDSISDSIAKTSPSEQPIDDLQTTMPGLTTKELREKLKEGTSFQTLQLLEEAVQATNFKEDDDAFRCFNNHLDIKTNINFQLDSEELRKQVAYKSNIRENRRSSFATDLKDDAADPLGYQPTTGKEANRPPQIYTQTHCESEDDKKLKPGDLLETLWENQYFKDDLSEALDVEYELPNIHNHRHLAQEFKIAKEELTLILAPKTSPSEQLIRNLQTKRPGLTIKDLCGTLTEAKAFQTRRLIEKAVKVTSFKEDDVVFTLFDKDWDLKKNVIIQLDSKELWKTVADKFNIREEEWACFAIDQKCNPAGNLFDVLRTQSPHLKTSTFKEHLRKLEQNDMLEKMKDIKGLDESHLSELSSHAALMCDVILPTLNAPGNDLLYKLAEMFKKDGHLRNVDINTFKVREKYKSPTVEMMDYIVCSQPIEYKIQDLVDGLKKIERDDLVSRISKYAYV